MSDENKYIAFDLGAETGRCVVATLRDRKIELNEIYRFNTHSIKYEKGFYWDILNIFEEIVRGLEKARMAFGPRFDGIGVDTWGVDYVLLDADRRIIGYPYHYRDDRTDGIMDETFRLIPREEMYRRSGIQFAQFNTVFQLLSEKKRKSSFLNLANKLLLLPDFLNFLLTGEIKSEYTIASTTGLTDPFKRNWAWNLIDKIQIPSGLFSQMTEPGTVLGRLLPDIAEKTGLDADVPVIATAGHDTASAIVAVPSDDSGNWAFLSSGTWSLMGVELDKPFLSARAMECNFTNEGGLAGTTRFLKNIIGLWPLQECKRYWSGKSTEYSYSALTELARSEGAANAWIDLSDPRFLKPDNMPQKILDFLKEFGQTPKSEIGYIAKVILESLAFSYRNVMRELEDITGKRTDRIYVVGGGTQNDLLMQLTADAVGCKIISGPVEGAVVGNVGVQAIATGAVAGLHEWRQVVADSFRLCVYEPGDSVYFAKNDKAYRALLAD
jgi:rhamnulokinase